MKAFRFSLESVLRWRTQQLEAEEWKLQQALAYRQGLLNRQEQIIAGGLEAARQLCAQEEVEGAALQRLQAYRNYLEQEHKRVSRDLAASGLRIEQHRREVTAADRRKRLLERLRERKKAEWEVASDREWEALAAETYLALRQIR
jgi:flagellar protein FliJ